MISEQTIKEIEKMVSEGSDLYHACLKLGVSYQVVHKVFKSKHPNSFGGFKVRDLRDLKEKIEDFCVFKDNGCIEWTGKSMMALSSKFRGRTPGAYVAYLLGRSLVRGSKRGRNCGNDNCYHPEHLTVTKSLSKEDLDEIKLRWKLNIMYKVTMQELANEYGITRQRIEQIVNKR